MVGDLSDMHQDFVFNAPGSVGGQLDVLLPAVGTYRFDEANGSDGNEVLNVHPCVLKPAGDVDHQAEVALNEDALRLLFSRLHPDQVILLLCRGQRRRQHIAAPYVIDAARFPKTQSL